MRELKPYQTLAGAKAALDNGGRFYNLLTMADDNRISKAELSKAAGVFRSEQAAFLFLDMALADLTDGQRSEVLSLLESKLAKRYKSHGPRRLAASAMASEAQPGQLVVVEGYPRFYVLRVGTEREAAADDSVVRFARYAIHHDKLHEWISTAPRDVC
jgi:hypothetical protein